MAGEGIIRILNNKYENDQVGIICFGTWHADCSILPHLPLSAWVCQSQSTSALWRSVLSEETNDACKLHENK